MKPTALRRHTRGEVLALCLARNAGINVASARIVELEETPIAILKRFDRDAIDARIPYQSAASMLQASHSEERSYSEIDDVIRATSYSPNADLQELWRVWCSTCSSPMWTTICKTMLFCMWKEIFGA